MKTMWSEPTDFPAAEIEADKLLRRLGIDDPSRIELEDLAYAVGVSVREGDLDGAEAWLVRDGGRGIIRIRISDPGRKRFSIAHELGHWIMHQDRSQLSACLTSAVHGYQGSRTELEANAFAGHLLLPTRLLTEQYTTTLELGVVAATASVFTVSVTVAAVRLIELTNDPCLVVFSDLEAATVHWWRRGRKCPWLWLESKQPLSERSVAGDIVRGSDAPAGAVRVDPAAWFEHIDGHEDFTVYEETIRLGRYSTILTLLSVDAEDQ